MRKKSFYSHLSLYEREQIFVYKRQGKSRRSIAKLLKRSPSTISRELMRNSHIHPLMTGYLGVSAHLQAKQRKARAGKSDRLKNEKIRRYVKQQMKIGGTPEIIAHYVSKAFHGLSISHI